MIVGELVLSVKTLELELKAERAKSEAMRHNLRALASAGPSISPRGQDSQRAPSTVYKNAAQAPQPRYLVGGGVQYKTFRPAPPTTSPPPLNLDQRRPLPSAPYHAQTARTPNPKNGPLPGSNFPNTARPSNTSSVRPHSTGYNAKARIAALFAEPGSYRSSNAFGDAIDNFDINDIIIDSPFASPFDTPAPASALTHEPTHGASSTDSMPQNDLHVQIPPTSLPSSSAAVTSTSEPQADHVYHHSEGVSLSKSNPIEKSSQIRPAIVPPLSASADFSWSRDSQADTLASPSSPTAVFVDLSADEPLTSDRILEVLQHALQEGTRQKIELERARKLLLVQNMQAPVAPLQPVSPMESSKSSPESPLSPTLDSKPSSLKLLMKRIKPKAMSVSVSHPVGLRVGSYRAEQDEFERIFYLTKDFIDTPSAAQRAEEAKFPEAFRRKIGILKESLDYDVDFAECSIYVIPPFVLDNLCKTTRFTLSDNQLTEIPNQIRKFDKLEEFNLANNLLVRIPTAISNLRALRALSVSNNKISEIPVELSHLPLLEFLDLAENQISEVPKHIGWQHSLKHLILSKNPITTLPAEISLCSKLQHLEASTCFLKKIPKEIAALAELEILDISYNNIKELPLSLGLMPKLRQLHVENNQLTDFPLSLGFGPSPLLTSGRLSFAPNPLNNKIYSSVIEGETSIADFLINRAAQNSKSLSKLAIPALPKLPAMAPFKPAPADTERWTLQEKMLCCGDWVSHTIDNYLRPAISTLFTSLTTINDLESPQLRKIVQVMRLVKTVIWRSEGLLNPPSFQKDRTSNNEGELERTKAILTDEFMALDTVLRSLQPIIRTAAISEKIGDTVTVVNIVHFTRDLLFVLVLDETRAVASTHLNYYQRQLNQQSQNATDTLPSPTSTPSNFAGTMRNSRIVRTDSSPSTPANSVLLPLPSSSNQASQPATTNIIASDSESNPPQEATQQSSLMVAELGDVKSTPQSADSTADSSESPAASRDSD